MITAQTRGLFRTHREAEKRETKGARLNKSEAGKQIAPAEDTIADPMTTLGLPEHACRQVTELHMGKKGISRLHPSFLTFGNLEELWLNENRLKRVVGLLPPPGSVALADGARGCARLKRLYLSGNVISALDGDVLRLGNLEVLLMANNRLSNLEAVSKKLTALRFLRQLDLFGNPLAEEQNYRLYLIHHHPNIELLDRQSVSPEERRAAAAFFASQRRGLGGGGVVGAMSSSVGTASTGSRDPADVHTATLASMRAAPALPTGFGSHVAPHAQPKAANSVSMTAQIVSSKVKHLQMKERAAAEIERQRDETEAHARAEKRRLFHSIWAMPSASSSAKQPDQQQQQSSSKKADSAAAAVAAGSSSSLGFIPPPSAAAAASRLFDDGENNAAVNELIELARQRELATTDQRRAEVEAQIAKKKHQLMPDRLGDNFGNAAKRAADAKKAANDVEYTEQVIKNVFTPFEVEQIHKAFGTNPVDANDAAGLVKLLQRCSQVSAKGFAPFFKQRLGTKASSGVTVREALRITADYQPFLEAREADLSQQSQSAIARGSGASAAASFRVANFVADHLRRVQKEEAASRGTSRNDDGVGHALSAVFARPGARQMAAAVVDSDDDDE